LPGTSSVEIVKTGGGTMQSCKEDEYEIFHFNLLTLVVEIFETLNTSGKVAPN
jgi:hypothetical protein